MFIILSEMSDAVDDRRDDADDRRRPWMYSDESRLRRKGGTTVAFELADIVQSSSGDDEGKTTN